MTKNILALLAVVSLSAPAFAVEDAYFQIKKVNIKEVTAQYAQSKIMALPVMDNCREESSIMEATAPSLNDLAAVAAGELNPITEIGIYLDQIINLGHKVWAIVELGKPVQNVNMNVANALPKGIECWSDLSGWKAPQSKIFSVEYINGFGAKVVTFTYRVTFTAGGGVNGRGKYLTNATFMPANLKVSWGFKFNAVAEVPSVFNMGSKEDPIAGMQMVLKWNVDSPLSHMEQTETYFVSGDNQIEHLK